jgi:hypothetical protein
MSLSENHIPLKSLFSPFIILCQEQLCLHVESHCVKITDSNQGKDKNCDNR